MLLLALRSLKIPLSPLQKCSIRCMEAVNCTLFTDKPWANHALLSSTVTAVLTSSSLSMETWTLEQCRDFRWDFLALSSILVLFTQTPRDFPVLPAQTGLVHISKFHFLKIMISNRMNHNAAGKPVSPALTEKKKQTPTLQKRQFLQKKDKTLWHKRVKEKSSSYLNITLEYIYIYFSQTLL